MLTPRRPSTPDGAATPDKRTQILAGARRVFMEDGYERASMNRIAEAAGVSKATLYSHFSGKDALFGALMAQQIAAVGPSRFALADVEGSPDALLTGLGVGFISAVLDPEALRMYRVILSENDRFPELGRAFEQSGPAPGLAHLTAYLRKLCAAGVLDIDDVPLAAEQFMAMCDAGLLRRAHLHSERPEAAEIARVVATAVRVFLRGYAPEAVVSRSSGS
jgi:TetR/AcrR family transcriptional regulator, mexJK operon transcriptional repressor